MSTRLLALVAIVTSGVVLASLTGRSTTAKSQEANSPGERFTNYVQPTGPEITPQIAVEKAIQRVFDTEQADSPASISPTIEVAHSTEAIAAAVQEGQKPASAQTVGSDPEQTEIRQSTVYLVVMRGTFSPLVSTPRGKPGPKGTILTMVLDAHTGFVISLQLGGSAPRATELGAVSSIVVEPSLVAKAAERASVKGMLLGTVYKGSRHAVGWRTVVTWDHHRLAKRTGSHGGFTYELMPGKYTITAYAPSGKVCSQRTTTIIKRRKRFVILQCK